MEFKTRMEKRQNAKEMNVKDWGKALMGAALIQVVIYSAMLLWLM